jgi:hypothetical protein
MYRFTIRNSALTGTLLCAASLMCCGCVERLITITSEPSGALVHLNDEEVGRTPLTVPFTFYGTYDVRLETEGYEPLWTMRKAKAPWWETPPVDLLVEALPSAKSHLTWHFKMETEAPEDEQALLGHARQIRAMVGNPIGTSEQEPGPAERHSADSPNVNADRQ